MAGKDKPYRVYRGGRAKGPIRHEPPKKEAGRRDGDGYTYKGPKPARKPRRWRRRMLWALVGVILLFLVWAVLGYLAFRSGIKDANKRLDPLAARALTPEKGLLLSNASNILVLGADAGSKSRQGTQGRSDTIILIRTDPDNHKIALLSIPRDLRVEIPRHGTQKINAAYAFGGATLAVKTVERVTGLRMNHVVVVDFSTFGEVVDALGGVTINVPHPILSNKFECPRHTQAQCARWPGWRFRKGPQEMNGRTALIYSRIRENKLDPSESDFTRGERQQAVIQAMADETTSFSTFLKAPFIGDDLVSPLATDLSAGQILQLGWVKRRTPSSGWLRCRLGGTIANFGGASYVIGSEENVSVIAMVTGKSAPQPPLPGSGPFGPGCLVGK
ncbi:MAG TPA: LCP family protein [Gaiellaceae bacterium]|nr:LCP family protein [Gaiellaceae bacterium]